MSETSSIPFLHWGEFKANSKVNVSLVERDDEKFIKISPVSSTKDEDDEDDEEDDEDDEDDDEDDDDE